MKTKIILIAGITAMLFASQNLKAQFNYGIHGGANLETQAKLGELWNNCEVYQGFMIGGFLEYKTGKNLSFQTELNYQKKGEKVKTTLEGLQAVNRREFNYISVPLLVKGTFHDEGISENMDLNFFAGPYAGFLTSANSRLKADNKTSPVEIERQAEKADLGVIFGGGLIYKLSNGGAIISELRYEMGLSKIDKQDPDLRNKGFGLTVGYRF
jgi:hypothetical protein